MADYDVSEALSKIEDMLISSMMRNLRHHLDLEKQEGISYTQWQAEQLAALADFRESTNTALGDYFKEFNERIGEALQRAYEAGGTEQETKILEALRKGWKRRPHTGQLSGSFFRINERRLNAYIASVKSDMERAEYALMRMADDQYRKAIFNAGVAYNTGAVTLPQAVDQATNDFLSRGLNCIEYRNGRRVNIDAYAEMAVRTSVTRSYLQGESAKRDEWGVNTVIVNKRGVACPKCLQYVGKVFYDDVYGHVKPQDGRYPLLSSAIAGGLYHPNCKDIHTTYFEGVSTPPEPLTAAEEQKAAEVYDLEQRQRYNERQIRKYKRLSEWTNGPKEKQKYASRLSGWQKLNADFVEEHGDVLKRRREREVARDLRPRVPVPPELLSGKSGVDKSAESGIIKSGSDSVALEYQRYGRNKTTLVNKTYIDGGEYRRKYDNATENTKVNKSLYDCAKQALKHRSGTVYEDMYWIDSETGDIIASEINSQTQQKIVYSEATKKVVSSHEKNKIITVHTHPNSMPPSAADFNSCYRNGYKRGYVACHDGKVFAYTSEQEISEELYSLYISSYISEGMSEYEAQIKTLEKLKENHLIDFWEVT